MYVYRFATLCIGVLKLIKIPKVATWWVWLAWWWVRPGSWRGRCNTLQSSLWMVRTRAPGGGGWNGSGGRRVVVFKNWGRGRSEGLNAAPLPKKVWARMKSSGPDCCFLASGEFPFYILLVPLRRYLNAFTLLLLFFFIFLHLLI